MPKHSISSSSSSSSKNIKKKPKKQKKRSDSLCARFTSINRDDICVNETTNSSNNEISHNCRDYFYDNSLIHSNDITELNANDYLELRKTKNAILNTFEPNLEEQDCIVINPGDNTIKINNALIQGNNITITNYISNGCYGVIFVSSQVDDIRYVIKFIIFNETNINEITTMINVKKNNNTYIPNFINIAYYHLQCRNISNTLDNNFFNGINTCLKDNKYSMIILEYFDGTILDLINSIFPLNPIRTFTPEDIELFNSIFAQLIISIYLFHNKFNYIHKDAHLKNFLYKKVNADDKYFHYKIGDNNYYIKNCGYLVVLSDYGLSINISSEINKFKDYNNILFFISKYIKSKTILKNYLDYSYCDYINHFNEFDFLNYMMTTILNIKTEKTVYMTLINDIPYE